MIYDFLKASILFLKMTDLWNSKDKDDRDLYTHFETDRCKNSYGEFYLK